MVTIEARQAPVKLYGLPALEATGQYHRLPPELRQAVKTVDWLHKVPADMLKSRACGFPGKDEPR